MTVKRCGMVGCEIDATPLKIDADASNPKKEKKKDRLEVFIAVTGLHVLRDEVRESMMDYLTDYCFMAYSLREAF
jgi:hypothetical protein